LPRILFALALFVVSSLDIGSAASQPHETNAGWGLPQLMAELGAVKSSSAHFVEHKYLHMLTEPIEDSGTLFYRAPDQLRKDTLTPQIEHLIVDRDRLTIEGQDKTQTLRLDQYPQVWAIIEAIRATLAGDREGLERYYIVRFSGDAKAWQMSLVPRDPKIERIVRSIGVSGSGAHIEHVSTEEADGDRSEMSIAEDSP
jgi:Outer membrane lipoprotein carrier protein LolA-like